MTYVGVVCVASAILGAQIGDEEKTERSGQPKPAKTEETKPAKDESSEPGSKSATKEPVEEKEKPGDQEKKKGPHSLTVRDAETGEEVEGFEIKGFTPGLPQDFQATDPNPTPVDNIKPVTTESGLKYWDIKVGDGEQPLPDAKVTIAYRSWLPDGALLDSSGLQGYTPTYSKRGALKGIYEGVWSMRVGGIRRLEIPPELAYGEKGKPPSIPPNATLTFEVELLKVKQPPRQTSVDGITAVVTGSGLKYWDIKVGHGEQPAPLATVTVDYSCWLEDGTLVDSSVERGSPVTFRLDRVIPGWMEGLTSMRAGGKRRLEIPPELCYGEKGGGAVPPGATMICEVELREVQAPPPPRAQASVEGIEPVTTSSGLKYWDIRGGDGRASGPRAMVTVHFTTWLADGTMVQDTRGYPRPLTLSLKEAAQGLAEGIGSMKVGGIRRLEIPPELGYGKKGKPGMIPPNAALIVEVELFGFTAVPEDD